MIKLRETEIPIIGNPFTEVSKKTSKLFNALFILSMSNTLCDYKILVKEFIEKGEFNKNVVYKHFNDWFQKEIFYIEKGVLKNKYMETQFEINEYITYSETYKILIQELFCSLEKLDFTALAKLKEVHKELHYIHMLKNQTHYNIPLYWQRSVFSYTDYFVYWFLFQKFTREGLSFDVKQKSLVNFLGKGAEKSFRILKDFSIIDYVVLSNGLKIVQVLNKEDLKKIIKADSSLGFVLEFQNFKKEI